jgi:hypothetical protein
MTIMAERTATLSLLSASSRQAIEPPMAIQPVASTSQFIPVYV